MKKLLIPALFLSLFPQKSEACSWYDPDYEYFNLFTQNIIRDKSYTPFLLTYSARFYGDGKPVLPDENIEAWQKYFGGLTYSDAEHIVNHVPLAELRKIKSGNTSSDPVLAKLGAGFYGKYAEAMDYLIEAKYLEPYMRISYVESPDTFYYRENDDNAKDATSLDYAKTVSALHSLYNAAKNPEIKLRYGYQLVRFNHYTRHFEESISAFKKYVEPLKLHSAPYYLALDQYAGAQRGLGLQDEANWNFFQVFMNSKSRKQEAYVSMKLSDSASFNNMLKRAQSTGEKCTAYFLLGYQDFNNPLPMMEKIYALDPNSETLKVLAARAVNELERSYLPVYYYQNNDAADQQDAPATASPDGKKASSKKEISFWQKVVQWFKNIFSFGSGEKPERSPSLSDRQYLNNPDRIPFFNRSQYSYYYPEESQSKDYLGELQEFTEKIQDKNNDEFWKIADAYLLFLKKDYSASSDMLNGIKTSDRNYQAQITRLKMLNEIVSQPKITPGFEDTLYKNYIAFFKEKETSKTSDSARTEEAPDYQDYLPSTEEFLRDVLANRYFLQGEDAKSFLMNNRLSDLRFNPNLDLARKLQAFIGKKDKTAFEQQIIAQNINDVGNPDAFFNVIYGDFAMRNADFEAAKKYYGQAEQFSGLPVPDGYYDYNSGQYVKYQDTSGLYNGFSNISGFIFGHNVWESYESPVTISMKAEDFVPAFPAVKGKMNKLEIAEAALNLKKLAAGKGERAAQAGQLIGNLLYNTSVLGYFRETFVMDIDNSNGGKYNFGTSESPFHYYYKNYSENVFIKPDNFDLATEYYRKALQNTANREQKARILFQIASAEQGKYYQWEAQQAQIPYSDKDWEKKQKQQEINFAQTKNERFRSSFAQLKQSYSDTETVKHLMGSCSYFDYFMKK